MRSRAGRSTSSTGCWSPPADVTVVSVEPTGDWVAWGEVRRAAVMLALFDLVLGFPPMIGTAARHIREWSPTAWAAIVVLGIGPLLTTLL